MSEEQLTKKERLAKKRAAKEEKQQQEEQQAKKKKGFVVGSLAILVALIIWGLTSAANNNDPVNSLFADPALGPDTAPVLIEAYEDFECPACAATAPVIKDILERYGDDVQFVYNDFPLPQHLNATTAAVGAECALRQDSDAFWEYHDLLFARQSTWSAISSNTVLEDTLQGYAEEVGVDLDEFITCVASEDASDAVNEDLSEARSRGVNSTPSFFVNGERITDGPFSASIPAAIDAALAQ